jgi:hypothetical protein
MVRDWPAQLEAIIDLGFHRLLSSGLSSTALEGAPTLAEVVKQVCGLEVHHYLRVVVVWCTELMHLVWPRMSASTRDPSGPQWWVG